MVEVACGARTLRIDAEPRLVLFGFDADQWDGALAQIKKDLRGKHQLQVYAVGRPGTKMIGAFRRPRDSQPDKVPGTSAAAGRS